MRKSSLVAAWVLLVGSPNVCLPQDNLVAIIDNAIQAHGGEQKLRQCAVGMIKGKGTIKHDGNGTLMVSMEDTFSLPDHFKRIITIADHGTTVIVRNGKRAWFRADDGIVRDVDAKQAGMSDQHALLSFCRLSSLRATDPCAISATS
jgi:hypothetical protein